MKIVNASFFVGLFDRALLFLERVILGSAVFGYLSAPANEGQNDGIFAGLIRGVLNKISAVRDGRGLAYSGRELFGGSASGRVLNYFDSLFGSSLIIGGILRACGIYPAINETGAASGLNKKLSAAVLILFSAAVIASLFFFPPFYVFMGIAGIFGMILIAARPETGLIATVGLIPFTPTMFLAGMVGYTLLCLIAKLFTDGAYSARIDPTGLALIFYVVVGLFYGATSFSPSDSVKIALLTSLLTVSYFLTVSLIDSIKKMNAVITVFCFSAALTGLYGILQKVSGAFDMTWVDRELFEDLTFRVYSTFENPNVYGAYLLLAVPACAAMAFCAKRVWQRLAYAGAAILLVGNLAYTYSRGCYIALGVTCFVFVLFYAKRLVPFFFAGLAGAWFILPPDMARRIVSITNLSDSSTSYRIYIWQATLRILKDFWVSGLGQGIKAYNAVYPLYAFNNVSAPHTHNLYLQIFVETGIVGLCFFLLTIAFYAKAQVPFFRETGDKMRKLLSLAMFSAVLGFLFQGVFDYVFYNYRLFLTFFIYIGIGNGLVRVWKTKEG